MAIDKDLSAKLSKVEFHCGQSERLMRHVHSAIKDVIRSGDEKVVQHARLRFGKVINEINEHLTALKILSEESR